MCQDSEKMSSNLMLIHKTRVRMRKSPKSGEKLKGKMQILCLRLKIMETGFYQMSKFRICLMQEELKVTMMKTLMGNKMKALMITIVRIPIIQKLRIVIKVNHQVQIQSILIL